VEPSACRWCKKPPAHRTATRCGNVCAIGKHGTTLAASRSSWFGQYTKSGQRHGSAIRDVSGTGRPVIHGGRPGDGIEWCEPGVLAAQRRAVIDGIAVRYRRACPGQASIPSGQHATVTLKAGPAPNVAGGVITQTSTQPRSNRPPQARAEGLSIRFVDRPRRQRRRMTLALFSRRKRNMSWKLLKENLETRNFIRG